MKSAMLLILILLVTSTASHQLQHVTYTRWGRTTCEEPATVVYTGIMAGSHYTHKGGGSNYLCLHDEPDYLDRIKTPWQTEVATINGAEFQYAGTSQKDRPFSFVNNNGNNLNNHDLPCVVCMRSNRSSQIMIPGKFDCGGTEFSREYSGFLVSGHYNHAHTTEHICLDEAPETREGGQADHNGALVNVARTSCTSGAPICPPYSNNYNIPCSVCSI